MKSADSDVILKDLTLNVFCDPKCVLTCVTPLTSQN